ncbi:adenylosuccinate lyase [Alkaliphilus peptidifermentans]|uniref:Adenylosuccinate lyase n=1 Tax=Alkaliphilus peptidifermentans DSM 18978 TaxID=1120976 RepID=A0A1G5D9R3_9FIRM|nr:adenylosuccinate lyase [Alkaliphilus peptidifermentans]SCY11297.1 adenylosuccinate lyase [Alkaliphilus peptidifermentans DSM 18978]
MSRSTYQNPLIERYSSKEMSYIFSSDKKFTTWRRLWVALAEAEKDLGLPITNEQIEELKANQDNINYDVAIKREKETRHDVMSHVYAFGQQCPKAKGIIHLGATSAFVGDNTDIIVMKEALQIIKVKMINLFNVLAKFCDEYKNLPALGFTHFQPAQLTTLGKRGTLWLHDLLMDFENLEYQIDRMKLRGVKGTTGTQASFYSLFDNDDEKVELLDKRLAEKMGFKATFPVTGQTYSRKLDFEVLSILSGIAQSLHKMTNDLRLLQSLKEVEEPFEKSQIGSSAMAYKRNPMRSERIASLARYVIAGCQNTAMTASTQWFERTLDDSANRRIIIPEAFLATDAILNIAINVCDGLVVYDKMIQRHIDLELPFMVTENILMEAVKRGGDRQELHERIRTHSMEAAKKVKQDGEENDLINRILADTDFNLSKEQLNQLLDSKKFVGRAPQQVTRFLNEFIYPILEDNKALIGLEVDLWV